MKIIRSKGLREEDFLLAVLKQFQTQGKEEVSLAEVLESVQKLCEKIDLKYNFYEKVLYSSELFRDLDELIFKGYVQEVVYAHDAFLPKRYVTLTSIGKLQAEEILKRFTENIRRFLSDSVDLAMQNYTRRWRYWSRPSYKP